MFFKNVLKGKYMNNISSTILTNEEGKAKYDAVLKTLLSNKQFLSKILKRFTHEFKDASLSDIENKYIENNDIDVSGKMVGRNLTNIEGINTEDKTLNEGNVFYDIMFKASYPDYTGKYIGLYINIEIQNSYRRGYPIEKRGMYYAARRFGSQLKSITKETDYACLEKVYSVWICMGADMEADTATLYRTDKHDIIGKVNRKRECYDMMNVIILRINDRVKSEDKVLELLRVLCSNALGKEEKLSELKSLGIRLSDEIKKGVGSMCNLSELVEKRGIDKGIEQGENRFKELTGLLLKENKLSELKRATEDREYLHRLYNKYNLL